MVPLVPSNWINCHFWTGKTRKNKLGIFSKKRAIESRQSERESVRFIVRQPQTFAAEIISLWLSSRSNSWHDEKVFPPFLYVLTLLLLLQHNLHLNYSRKPVSRIQDGQIFSFPFHSLSGWWAQSWSCIVEEDEGWIRTSRKMLCLC